MSKERLEKLISVIEEKREEIIEKGIEQFKDRYSYNGLSGWHLGVEVDENGNVYLTGPMSCGSQTMATYKGEAVTVVSFSTENYEFEGQIENYQDRIDMEGFRKYLISKYDYDLDELEGKELEEALEEHLNMCEYQEFNPEQYAEFAEEDFEWYIDEYATQEVEERIDRTLEMLEQQLESYDEYCR